MKERPILFSAPTVRALLDGRKTQTRRVVKGEIGPCAYAPGRHALNGQVIEGNPGVLGQCPYGRPRDRLWVRETWAPEQDDANSPTTASIIRTLRKPAYAADWNGAPAFRWRPSIHMPRWASRLTLVVTEVRAQRLQEISEDDARAEGVVQAPLGSWCIPGYTAGWASPREAFRHLWDSINGERMGCSWPDNPWVWAVSFKVTP